MESTIHVFLRLLRPSDCGRFRRKPFAPCVDSAMFFTMAQLPEERKHRLRCSTLCRFSSKDRLSLPSSWSSCRRKHVPYNQTATALDMRVSKASHNQRIKLSPHPRSPRKNVSQDTGLWDSILAKEEFHLAGNLRLQQHSTLPKLPDFSS
jgi:hypothetical protein